MLLAVMAARPAPASGHSPQPLTVYAAVSLANALDEIGATYQRAGGRRVLFSYASSAVLARQIEAGAHADLYISADTEWMTYLQSRHLIDVASRRDLLGNSLVLIAPADSPLRLAIAPHFPLLPALAGGRLAMGDPDSVPAGRYARTALERLGLWPALSGQLALTDNVRSALAFVARGEAPLGIVYLTDARSDPRVRIIDTFPATLHAPIVYPVALTTGAQADARALLDFLRGATAAEIFRKYGFALR
jgi:molybdate transport system substrate-binding protein